MHYIIYTITNLINGKIYVGKHKCSRLDDRYFGSGKVLKEAIAKYGRENFVMRLEIDLANQAEMDLLEEMVVNKDFIARDDTYNISRGGKNPCMYGKDNPFFGKTHSRHARELISAANKGKTISESTRHLMSESLIKNYKEHPELKHICNVIAGKKKCISAETGEIKFFDKDNIPDGFTVFQDRKDRHVSAERKIKLSEERSIRGKRSKWFNDGKNETFCLPENAPEGYVAGRLPGLNVGRKYSAATLRKMRNSQLGKKSLTAGKIFITDGQTNRYIKADDVIPSGWRRGLTRRKRNYSEAKTND